MHSTYVASLRKLLPNVLSSDSIYRHGTVQKAQFFKAATSLTVGLSDTVFCQSDNDVPLTLVHSVQKIVQEYLTLIKIKGIYIFPLRMLKESKHKNNLYLSMEKVKRTKQSILSAYFLFTLERTQYHEPIKINKSHRVRVFFS